MQRFAAAGANESTVDVETRQGVGRTLAGTAEGLDGKADRALVSSIVHRVMERNPQGVGAYVGYEPRAFERIGASVEA